MNKDEALRLALEALELVSIEFVCNGAHHAKKDRHEWLDPCPIVDQYKKAITAIKAALEAPQRTWVGLKDDWDWKRNKHSADFQKGVDWAEEMLKGKNT